MSGHYLDASALVKRYVDETGSHWLRATLAKAQSPLFLTSRLTIIEVVSAFARRVRDGSLPFDEFATARDVFRGDCLNEYQIMPPTMAVIDLSCALLERHPCAPLTLRIWRQHLGHSSSLRHGGTRR